MLLLTTLRKKAFENNEEKGESAVTSISSIFHNDLFPVKSKSEHMSNKFFILCQLQMLQTWASLKFSRLVKELTPYYTIPTFNDPEDEGV